MYPNQKQAVQPGVSHSWVAKVEQVERRLDILEYVQLCKYLGVDPGKGLAKIKTRVKK